MGKKPKIGERFTPHELWGVFTDYLRDEKYANPERFEEFMQFLIHDAPDDCDSFEPRCPNCKLRQVIAAIERAVNK